MTLIQVLKSSSLPRPETEILLAFILKKTREFVLTYPETKITPAAYRRFRALEKKRLANWPIAYLTGYKEFYGLDFAVSPATLVPRPETEMIVDEINDLAGSAPRPLIIDLGTGSGAIIIATAHELKKQTPSTYRLADFAAIDISTPALKIAKKNAARYGLDKKIRFCRGNLLTPLLAKKLLVGRDLIIAANLPYLTPAQIKCSPSIKHEPELALDGGKDGLKYYRELFRQLAGADFRSANILCEIDPGQAAGIKALALKSAPNAKISIHKDLSGQDRLSVIDWQQKIPG